MIRNDGHATRTAEFNVWPLVQFNPPAHANQNHQTFSDEEAERLIAEFKAHRALKKSLTVIKGDFS